MKRPNDAIQTLLNTIARDQAPELGAVLNYLDAIESELAGYRSRDDSGFKRALEAQKG